MGVLGEKGSGWCFCSGGGGTRSERVKGSIFAARGAAIAAISTGGNGAATGFLIHRSLLLTTHANIPSANAAELAEVRLNHGRLAARLVPNRFFLTSSILDLTIVGLDPIDDDSSLQYLKTCFNTTLDLGSAIYLLGHTTQQTDLTIGEGKVVIFTDNLIKLSSDCVPFCRGSAGFDPNGNLSFMLCDPMKLATSPTLKKSHSLSSSTTNSSLSSRRDFPMQFGVPIPVILDWLHQHWSGSLDEVTKPKLVPAVRPVPVPVPTGEDIVNPRPRFQTGDSSSSNVKQLLDINFPPRPGPPRSIFLPLPLKHIFSEETNNFNYNSNNNNDNINSNSNSCYNVEQARAMENSSCCSEVQSSSSPVDISEVGENEMEGDGFVSSGEETMYSAETMESRNIPSPREYKNNNHNSYNSNNNKFNRPVGRSQSCVNNSRWISSSLSIQPKGALLKQNSLIPVRRANSHQGVTHRGSSSNNNDYFSPTVSSNMKKRNSLDRPVRARQSPGQAPASRWIL